MAGLPIDVRALYDAGKRFKEDREKAVRIAVLIEIDAPDALVEAARDAFHPRTANATVNVAVVEPDQLVRVDARADATVVLVGGGTHLGPTLADLKERAIPTALLALDRDRETLARLLGHPTNDVFTGADAGELLVGPLAEWAMARMPKLHAALGHNFEFMRRAVAKDAVQRTAWQNAAVGVLLFLPGADMPVMTLNQGKMLLQIAAAYGEPLDTARIKELAAVVAGGFVFRTLAREVVGVVPGVGWAIKGGIAYSGTFAMGMAAIEYFEKGADLGGVLTQLTDRAGHVAAQVGEAVGSRTRRRRALSGPETPEPAGYTSVTLPEPETLAQPSLLDVAPAAPTLTVQPAGREDGPQEGHRP